MADEGFGIYVFCPGKRDSFLGFCARLFGVLPGYARGIFSSIEKCNPILEECWSRCLLTVLLICVHLLIFVIGFPVWLWIHLEKKR